MKYPCSIYAGFTVEAGLLHGGLKARETLRACGLIGMALDEADADMTQAKQVRGHVTGSAKIVDPDATHVGAEAPRGHCNDRYARRRQLRGNDRRFAQRRREDHAGDALGQLARCSALGSGLEIVPFVEDQLGGAAAGLVEGPNQQFAQVGGARVGIDEGDAGALGARQGSRRGVRRVIELANGTHDQVPRGLTDVVFAVGHARNRHR